jgi:spore coat polysaccharide biosynthesis predicted glycosyltransferase SpsG
VLLNKEDSTYSAMLSSDLHISFASTTLLESAGLGVPTVCICGANTNGTLQALIGTSKYNEYIFHLDSPEAFFDLICKINESRDYYLNWKRETEKIGNTIFKKDFLKNSVQIINRQLHESF